MTFTEANTFDRYGCSDIARHDLQRLNYKVTEDLFAWKANLPSNLQVDPDNDTVPVLPHLLMLQYAVQFFFFLLSGLFENRGAN